MGAQHLIVLCSDPQVYADATGAGRTLANTLSGRCRENFFKCTEPEHVEDIVWTFRAYQDDAFFRITFGPYSKDALIFEVAPTERSGPFWELTRGDAKINVALLRSLCAVIHAGLGTETTLGDIAWIADRRTGHDVLVPTIDQLSIFLGAD